MCLKLTMKTPEQRQWHHSCVFTIDFELAVNDRSSTQGVFGLGAYVDLALNSPGALFRKLKNKEQKLTEK